jgi:long-chain acyl-CoA synthetase
MYLLGTHRSVPRRLRLAATPNLGAGNFFWHACATAPDVHRTILAHQGRGSTDISRYSLAELRSLVLRSVAWLRTQGVGPATRVGVYTTDGLLGLVEHIAITSLGGATVLTNPNMAPDVAADYFRRTGTGIVVGDTDLLTQVTASAAENVVVEDVRTLVANGAAEATPSRYRHRPDDLVLISHSSGTTGKPKPTSFTHRGFFIGKRERFWNFPSERSDRLLTALPHSHSSGISYLSLTLMLGLPTLMIDDTSGAAVAAAMNEFLPTIVLGFPLSLAQLPIDRLAPEAASTVHTWMGMGDASHERHIRPLVALGGDRAGSAYVDGLGSSEMGMVLFKNVHTATSARYDRMIGTPVGVVRKAAVLDEAGNELPRGRVGLLGVHTPSVTPGYVNAKELTDDARRGEYFLTGDVVRQDEAGNWYHLDRTPDVITTAAGQVPSLPLEEVLLNTTLADDAAVVAVDDPATPGRSLPFGIALFERGGPPDADSALAGCNTALAAQGSTGLAGLIVTDERDDVPTGVTGKVLKRVLRERHQAVLSQPTGAHTALAGGATTIGRGGNPA